MLPFATESPGEDPMKALRAAMVVVLLGFLWKAPNLRAQDVKAAAPALVTRGRVQLNLAGAEAILTAAKAKAAAMGLQCNIAIVDDGGNLLSFARMDGARPASGATALTKAVAAATFRQETGPLPAGTGPDLLLSLGLTQAAMAS